jgi:hypothetical protein
LTPTAACARERINAVLKAAEARFERETLLREKLMTGETTFDLHGLRDVLERKLRLP